MENYEKLYKQSLERARKLKEENPELWNSSACIIRDFFPELAERDNERNERIRTGLIKILQNIPSGTFKKIGGITLDEGLYWLERKEYEKQGEQKSVEWSEEDERMYRQIIAACDCKCVLHQYEIDWLKSLKDRYLPQPKQEWSEEDEAAYNKALDAYYYKDLNDKDDVVFALKNLTDLIAKHRKTIPPYQRWKPTKEQMDALKRAHNRYDLCNICGIGVLESLYKDLEKLM